MDDVWVSVRAQHPKLPESSGKGYRFGCSEATRNPDINRERVSTVTKLLEDLASKVCDAVVAVD